MHVYISQVLTVRLTKVKVYVCEYVCVCVYLHTYIYIYIYIYIHTHTHIHIHTHTLLTLVSLTVKTEKDQFLSTYLDILLIWHTNFSILHSRKAGVSGCGEWVEFQKVALRLRNLQTLTCYAPALSPHARRIHCGTLRSPCACWPCAPRKQISWHLWSPPPSTYRIQQNPLIHTITLHHATQFLYCCLDCYMIEFVFAVQ